MTTAADNKRIREAVAKYIRDVDEGKIVAGDLVIRAVRRHLWDLKHLDDLRHKFDEDAACRVIRFFGMLRHWEGREWAGKPFTLSPWQMFVMWVLFGWKRADGTRRFRVGFIEVARKNGKSSWLGAVALYLLMADGEQAAQIFSAATKKEQARLIVNHAAMMARKSPSISGRVVVSGGRYVNNVSYPAKASKIEALAADSGKLDGLNPSANLIDELHAHPDRRLWDVLDSATGARQQPLMLAITTAGYNSESIGAEMHGKAEKVLEGFDKTGGVTDDTFFAFVAAASPADDPYAPQTWAKANPNLGVSVKLDDLERKAHHAKQFSSARNEFFRKHLNLWTQADTAWLDLERWDACRKPFTLDDVAGWECWGAMDLAAKVDLTALVLLFRKDGRYRLLPWFWMPETAASDRRQKDPVWGGWLDAGLIETTPGDITDYDFIEARIVELAGKVALKEIAADPWNLTQVGVHLRDQHGIPIEEFRQGVASYNDPTREFERLVVGGLLEHDGNAVLRWMAGNVSVHTDAAGNIKPVKPPHASGKKIDGIAAAVMALGRAIGGETSEAELDDIPCMVAGTR
jgi:phage terminase large subunit-like protein